MLVFEKYTQNLFDFILAPRKKDSEHVSEKLVVRE